MATTTKRYDLADNAGRGIALAKLIEAASSDAKPSLNAWVPPVPQMDPPSGTWANSPKIWKLSNDLRIMSQYVNVLRESCDDNYFLTGAPQTCVEGLEWFINFTLPTSPLTLKTYQDLNDLLLTCANKTGVSLKQAGFNLHRSVAKPQRELTQLLLEQHFDGPFKQYELDVCAYMLAKPDLTYSDWINAFPNWKLSGLYFPLAISAAYMPSIDCWLPLEVRMTRLATTFQYCLDSLRKPGDEHRPMLCALTEAWKHDTSGSSQVIGCTLDRLAVLMGIKSNGNPFDLTQALKYFSSSAVYDGEIHGNNYQMWHHIKRLVEQTFPPSLLCTQLVCPNRDTWGYSSLTLTVSIGDPPILHFSEFQLEHVKPITSTSSVHTYNPAFIKKLKLHQTPQRIQDVLWRLGEIVTSPEVSTCMLDPDNLPKLFCLEDQPCQEVENHKVCHILSRMEERYQTMTSHDYSIPVHESYITMTSYLDSLYPIVLTHYLPRPCNIVMWRLDIPSRAILYVGEGDEINPYMKSQHHLTKVLLNTRLHTKPVGGIIDSEDNACETTIRNCVKAFAVNGLSTHPANTVLVTSADTNGNKTMPVTCTTLAESVACFSLTSPSHMNCFPLGASCSWNEIGIDSRYGEKQIAKNGMRLRDWMAIHIGKQGTQQSRLAAHVISYDCLHTTLMPWISQDHDEVKWVHVNSTLPPSNMTLRGKNLKRAVESRFLHDLKMIPTDNIRRVERQNCELYTDASGKVALAYSLEGCVQIHFIVFELCRSS